MKDKKDLEVKLKSTEAKLEQVVEALAATLNLTTALIKQLTVNSATEEQSACYKALQKDFLNMLNGAGKKNETVETDMKVQ